MKLLLDIDGFNSFPSRVGPIIVQQYTLLLFCIRMFSIALPPCARGKQQCQLHLGILSPVFTVLVSVKPVVFRLNFFDILISAPFPSITNIPECPQISQCIACDQSIKVMALSSVIAMINGRKCVLQIYCSSHLSLFQSLSVTSFTLVQWYSVANCLSRRNTWFTHRIFTIVW